MRIWLHTKTGSTGDLLGFLDVRPDNAARAMINAGVAVHVNAGFQLTPSAEAKWAGNSAIVDLGSSPSVIVAPKLSGEQPVGSMLVCAPGSYFGIPAPTVTRTWNRDGAPISGETGLTYVTQVADAGTEIIVEETATNSEGSTSAFTNTIEVI